MKPKVKAYSILHASSIGVIRNLRTGVLVLPQFHVVYDDHFTTVGADVTGDNLPVPTGFNNLMIFSRENFTEYPTEILEQTTPLQEVEGATVSEGENNEY